jgi:predicted nucleic acid-binding protein
MRLLLDTSAYSAFKRGLPALVEAIRQATLIVLTPVVLAELLSGFVRGSQEQRNRRELHDFLRSPRVRVLPIGAETAERFAVIHRDLHERGTPIPTNDLWIAASAMEHGLRVLTTDAHFQRARMIVTDYVALPAEPTS